MLIEREAWFFYSANKDQPAPPAWSIRNTLQPRPLWDIRVAGPEDAEAIYANYVPIVSDTAISFEDAPSVEDMCQRIATTLQTYLFLVAVQDGRNTYGFLASAKYWVRSCDRGVPQQFVGHLSA